MSSQTMTGSIPLVHPMDISRWHQSFSTVQVSHDRYHDDSSPAPIPETPELDHTDFTSEQTHQETFTTPKDSYMLSPRGTSPSWTGTRVGPSSIFTPVAYKTAMPLPDEAYSLQMPVPYPYSQPYGLAPEMEREAGKMEKADRKHVCPVCDKRFNRPSSLTTHMAVHTGAKPYQCHRADCGRRFSVSSNLRRHERTHIGHQSQNHDLDISRSGQPEVFECERMNYHPVAYGYPYYPYTYADQPPTLEYSGSGSSDSSPPDCQDGLAQYQITRKRRRADEGPRRTPRSSLRIVGGAWGGGQKEGEGSNDDLPRHEAGVCR